MGNRARLTPSVVAALVLVAAALVAGCGGSSSGDSSKSGGAKETKISSVLGVSIAEIKQMQHGLAEKVKEQILLDMQADVELYSRKKAVPASKG